MVFLLAQVRISAVTYVLFKVRNFLGFLLCLLNNNRRFITLRVVRASRSSWSSPTWSSYHYWLIWYICKIHSRFFVYVRLALVRFNRLLFLNLWFEILYWAQVRLLGTLTILAWFSRLWSGWVYLRLESKPFNFFQFFLLLFLLNRLFLLFYPIELFLVKVLWFLNRFLWLLCIIQLFELLRFISLLLRALKQQALTDIRGCPLIWLRYLQRRCFLLLICFWFHVLIDKQLIAD